VNCVPRFVDRVPDLTSDRELTAQLVLHVRFEFGSRTSSSLRNDSTLRMTVNHRGCIHVFLGVLTVSLEPAVIAVLNNRRPCGVKVVERTRSCVVKQIASEVTTDGAIYMQDMLFTWSEDCSFA